MSGPQVFPFQPRDPSFGTASLAPVLELMLTRASQQVSVSALLDTGAAISLLPYRIGAELGFDWDRQRARLPLTGAIATVEAKLIIVSSIVGHFPPLDLAFAWARSDDVPTLLGRSTFFEEFDVCFFRRRGQFQIDLAQGP